MAKPVIRLKGFEGEWQDNVLGNVCSVNRGVRVTRKELDITGSYPVYQNTDYPMGFYNRYNVKGNNPFVIIGGSAGLIGFSENDFWAADDCAYFSDNEEINKTFLYYTLLKQNSIIKNNVRGSSVPRLDRKVLVNLKISLPPINEQQAIADYFKSLDKMIQGATKKIESLKKMKSASLISMLPQAGETTPRVRFKGFEGEWERRSFEDVFSFLKNNSLSRAELDNQGDVMNVHYGDILIKFGNLIDLNKDELPYIKNRLLAKDLAKRCKLVNGDVIFADAAEDNTVGKCAEIVSVGERDVVSGLHTIPCRANYKFSEGFLGYCLNASSFHNQLLPLIQGTKISSISKTSLRLTYILYPTSLIEQQQIALFFRSLDSQVSMQEARLVKLKQIKSACLDKMFV